MDIISGLLILIGAVKAVQTEPIIEPINKQEVVLEYFVEELAKCESGQNPLAINPHDSGSPSYGYVQFKKSTWENQLRYYKMLPEAEDKELMNFIHDKDIQVELAKKMIKDGKWKHWQNCAKKTGLDKFVYEAENN